METTQEQPQLNKDDNPTVIQLQTIVIVNTTVVHGEHSTNDATTSSGEISSSSDNIFASNYNLFTGDTNKKSNTFLSCKKFAYILAIILTICFISVLFLSPIISYITRDTYNLDSDYETQMINLSEACGILVRNSTCIEDIMSTYEALRSASQRTSPHCLNRTKELFCGALSGCNNMSYVRGLMCQEVRQEYCTAEWRKAEMNGGHWLSEGNQRLFNRSRRLIDCDEYGETATLSCPNQFGLDENGSICSPLCKDFSRDGEEVTTVFIATAVIAHLINIIGGIVVLIAAYKNRKNMFRYPQVLLIINTILMTILSCFVSFPNITMGAWNPFCSNKFLNEAQDNPTIFCELQGFIIFSILSMYGLFWLIYIVHLLLVLIYPLRSSRVYKLIHNKKLQIVEIACVFIVSVIPNIVLLATSQFRIISYPPLSCGVSIKLTFYGCVIPTMSINFVGLIVMLFILYRIHYHTKNKDQITRKSCISTPEVKVFVLSCYLFVLMGFLWISYTIYLGKSDEFTYYIDKYIHCLAGGVRNGVDCSEFRRRFETMYFKYFEIVHIAMHAFLNLTYLPFVLSYHEVKQSVRKFLSSINNNLD